MNILNILNYIILYLFKSSLAAAFQKNHKLYL